MSGLVIMVRLQYRTTDKAINVWIFFFFFFFTMRQKNVEHSHAVALCN